MPRRPGPYESFVLVFEKPSCWLPYWLCWLTLLPGVHGVCLSQHPLKHLFFFVFLEIVRWSFRVILIFTFLMVKDIKHFKKIFTVHWVLLLRTVCSFFYSVGPTDGAQMIWFVSKLLNLPSHLAGPCLLPFYRTCVLSDNSLLCRFFNFMSSPLPSLRIISCAIMVLSGSSCLCLYLEELFPSA